MSPAKRQPRYQHLADILRAQISSDALAHGSRLPSEPELSRQYGVSRGTVVKAIEMLVAEGLAVRRQGAGTFVARASLRRVPGRLMSFSETIADQGHAAGQRVLSFAPADKDTCASVGCFEPAMRLDRLRLVDGAAVALHSSFVPIPIIDLFSPDHRAALEAGNESAFSLYAAFEAAGFDVAAASEFVTARLATEAERTFLDLPDPAVVTVVTRQSRNNTERLIEVAEAVYPADRYTYETTLTRGQSKIAPFKISKPE